MNNKPITDPRFTKIFKDPRFKSMNIKDKKVLIDKRFKSVLKNSDFSTKPKFNEYGEEFDDDKILEDHYELEQPVDEEEVLQSNQHEQEDSQMNEDSQLDDDSDEDDIDDLMGQDEWVESEEQAPQISDATRRFAVQNYDWQAISAKDLMVLFNSFVPSGGTVLRVDVYPSQFGKQKMREESEHGPREIFKENFQLPEQRKGHNTVAREVNELILRGDQQDLDVDPIKLRKYEKDRLKYYFAVVECDSEKTADNIYSQCNGQEFELSNIKIDLRFVPDDIKFEEKPFQSCDKITHQGGTKNILSRAIGHTNVKLTWEEDQPKLSFWQGKTEEELDQIDWNEYLGDCGDDADDAQDFKQKLFNKTNDEEEGDWRQAFNKKGKNKKRDFDIEITFNTGFNKEGNTILDKKNTKKKSKLSQKHENEDFFVNESQKSQENQEEEKSYIERKLLRQEKIREQRALQKSKQKNNEGLALLVDQEKKEKEGYNPEDIRFKAVFSNPAFAIDPTDKHFDKRETTKVFQEQIKRKKTKLY